MYQFLTPFEKKEAEEKKKLKEAKGINKPTKAKSALARLMERTLKSKLKDKRGFYKFQPSYKKMLKRYENEVIAMADSNNDLCGSIEEILQLFIKSTGFTAANRMKGRTMATHKEQIAKYQLDERYDKRLAAKKAEPVEKKAAKRKRAMGPTRKRRRI